MANEDRHEKSGGLFARLRNWMQGLPETTRPEPPPASDLTLEQAVDGLLFPSETDAPIELFSWQDPPPFSPEALREQLQLPASVPLTTMDLESFFAPAVRVEDWFTPERRARAERFQTLLALLKQQLSDMRVYKFGRNEMPVIVVGRDAQGTWRGIKTVVVET